jgi:hypothetical protein
MVKKYDFIIKLFVVILAVLQPFIIHFFNNDLVSISQSWTTDLQPLFIFTNALVSYYFFDLPKWRVSAILLLLLTVFSVEDWFVLHNILAIGFFVSAVFPLWSLKRFRFYLPIYLLSILFLIFDGLYWMETWGIVTLCFYHIHIMLFVRKFIS